MNDLPFRCDYCEKEANARVRPDGRREIDVCEDHLKKAINNSLVPPVVYVTHSDGATFTQLKVKVEWSFE